MILSLLFQHFLRIKNNHYGKIELILINKRSSEMEEMANKLEETYEMLYHPVQRGCRLLNVEFLELKGFLVQSTASLQDREVLFKCYITARRNYVVRVYIDVLKRRGSLRFWDIFLFFSSDISVICLHEFIGNGYRKRTFASIAEIIFKREQHRYTEPNFRSTLSSLSSDSMLIQTFKELRELTLNLFFSGLYSLVQKLVGKLGTPDYDLLPVLLKDVLESHMVLLLLWLIKKKILKRNFFCYNLDEFFGSRKRIFTAVLDLLNQAVQLSATQLHSPVDVTFTDSRLEMIKAQIDANIVVLVSEQVTLIITQLNCIAKPQFISQASLK
uniref:Component of oligomeric Golgi complex 6 n=1 Tax=Wuchereria bancrofti TaxID=6293 RepID=A0A1I8EA77_WUCBA